MSSHTSMPPATDLVRQTEAVYYWETARDLLEKWSTVLDTEQSLTQGTLKEAYAPLPAASIPERKATLDRRLKTAIRALEGEITKIDPEMRLLSSSLQQGSRQAGQGPSPLSIGLAWRWDSKLLELESFALGSGASREARAFLRDRDSWSRVTVLAALRYQFQSALLELIPLEKEEFKASSLCGSSSLMVPSSSSALLSMLRENARDALLGTLDSCKNASQLKGIGRLERSVRSPSNTLQSSRSAASEDSSLNEGEALAVAFFEKEVASLGEKHHLPLRHTVKTAPACPLPSGEKPEGEASAPAGVPPPNISAAAESPAVDKAGGGCAVM